MDFAFLQTPTHLQLHTKPILIGTIIGVLEETFIAKLQENHSSSTPFVLQEKTTVKLVLTLTKCLQARRSWFRLSIMFELYCPGYLCVYPS